MKTSSLGGQVRRLRNEKGISLRELARRVGISASFLSDIELGRRYPSTRYLRLIAQELDVQAHELGELDRRGALEALRRRAAADPDFALALTILAEEEVGAEELLAMLRRAGRSGGRT